MPIPPRGVPTLLFLSVAFWASVWLLIVVSLAINRVCGFLGVRWRIKPDSPGLWAALIMFVFPLVLGLLDRKSVV